MKILCRRLAIGWLTLALLVFCLGGCRQTTKYTDQAFGWFDSYYTLTVYTEDQAEFDTYAAICRSVLSSYHQLLDVYRSYDGVVNLKDINDRAGTSVAVSEDLFAFLCSAKEYASLTNGYTNIAMGRVIALWEEARKAAADRPDDETVLPSASALAEALTHTDIACLCLNEEERTVTVTDPLLLLHAGAVGKGYAAQRAAEALLAAGCTDFLLDLGGNLAAYGQKPNAEPWLAAVRTPEGHRGYDGTVSLRGEALSTSGSYERYFTVNGTRYHHILHPQTGYPTATFVSVTVRCPNAAAADALSTALFSLSLSEGQALITSLADTEALWMTSDGETVLSAGWERNTED